MLKWFCNSFFLLFLLFLLLFFLFLLFLFLFLLSFKGFFILFAKLSWFLDWFNRLDLIFQEKCKWMSWFSCLFKQRFELSQILTASKICWCYEIKLPCKFFVSLHVDLFKDSKVFWYEWDQEIRSWVQSPECLNLKERRFKWLTFLWVRNFTPELFFESRIWFHPFNLLLDIKSLVRIFFLENFISKCFLLFICEFFGCKIALYNHEFLFNSELALELIRFNFHFVLKNPSSSFREKFFGKAEYYHLSNAVFWKLFIIFVLCCFFQEKLCSVCSILWYVFFRKICFRANLM